MFPAISIRQPWAWAILHAGKDVENRTWHIPAKFLHTPIPIHAGVKLDTDCLEFLEAICEELCPVQLLPKGGIVGALVFEGVNNRRTAFSPWRAEGQNHWGIERAWSVPFHPYRGQLGFFEVDYPYEVTP